MIGVEPNHSRPDIKRRVWEILDVAKPGDTASKVFDIFILSLIFLNVVAVVLGTVKEIEERFASALYWFEVISIVVFSLEYLARLWSCVSQKEYANPVIGRIRFIIKPLSVIDLLAFLPFYLWFVTIDLRFIRALRLFRIFRIAKLGRYSSSMRLLGLAIRNKKEDLVITMLVMVLLVVLASSFMYYAENEAQPDKFPDIPTTMWWAVVTLTTVGYGDVYPITTMGKFLAGVIAFLGIGMFALPTGIIGASFVEEIHRQKSKKMICPHCGNEIE